MKIALIFTSLCCAFLLSSCADTAMLTDEEYNRSRGPAPNSPDAAAQNLPGYNRGYCCLGGPRGHSRVAQGVELAHRLENAIASLDLFDAQGAQPFEAKRFYVEAGQNAPVNDRAAKAGEIRCFSARGQI